MTHLQKTRISTILNWVLFDFYRGYRKSPLWVVSFQNPRFFRSGKSDPTEKDPIFSEISSGNAENKSQLSRAAMEEAREALTEYLHSTRSLQFIDAEFISRNSPKFLMKLLRNSMKEEEVGWSMNRFLRYHPINEFEPFFESMGLEHSEYSHFLPRDLMFLNDDSLLLDNYHVLCDYGIPRSRFGNIFKEAKGIFKYKKGILVSKFQAFEEMGLSQSSVIKVVSSCPRLLIGDKNEEFRKLLEKFKAIGIEYDLVEGKTVAGYSYTWSDMHELLCLLSNMGCSDEQLQKLISNRPLLLLEDPRATNRSLIGLLLKFGSKVSEICYTFLELPDILIGKFLFNLRSCYNFLVDIEMEAQYIGRIVRSNPLMLGSCSLKKLNTLRTNVNAGKKRLCYLVKENPQILKDWVLGSKIKKLPNLAIEKSREMRISFLCNLGFVGNSIEMQKALKVFRGKGEELQERFDYLVKVGLNKDDVVEMIKVAPQILNQKKEIIQAKIDVLVKELEYPVLTLVKFPAYLSYTRPRVMLRYSMYNWLKNQGHAEPYVSLSTIVPCSDKLFMTRYVMKHPRGPEVLEEMKKEMYSNYKLYV